MDLIREFKPTDLNIKFIKLELEEIQSDLLETVSKRKALNAFERIKDLTMIEDDGLFIDSLNGFPGAYSSYVFKTIGNDGIIKLLSDEKNRKAMFRSVFALHDGNNIHLFVGEKCGSISHFSVGEGWGYDPIFIPDGFDRTFADLGYEFKNKISHRRVALEKLCNWYLVNKYK
jgi:XTP/dITP diphosphohydrolase